MSAAVHDLPLAGADVTAAWTAFDDARMRLEALYADAASTPPQRREKCNEVAKLWARWQALFLRDDA